MYKQLYEMSQEWSIPAKMFRPLLDALRSDLSAAGIEWKGDSETLKKHFHTNRIDPKVDGRYRRFFVNRRHTAAVTYTWKGTNLLQIADQAELQENLSELVWNDVLVVNQFSISSSDQVVGTTDLIYRNCKVWVFLDDDYLSRAWCLAETGQYTNPESGCEVIVYGKAEMKPGTNFFGDMTAGVKEDVPLIQKYILGKYSSVEAFNQAIDRAILRLSPLSLIYQGRYKEALQACEQEIEMLHASESNVSVVMAKAKATTGLVMYLLGEYDSAMASLTSALEMPWCRESELELLGNISNYMGLVLIAQGKYSEALERFSELLDFRTRCFGTGHVSVAQTYNNMGNVYQKQGDYEKALFHFQSALDIKIKSLGGAHVSVATTYGNMGVMERNLGNLQKALDLYEKALEIEKKTLGEEHVSIADSEVRIANVQSQQGNYENALFRYELALKIYLKCLGPSHASVANTEMNIGIVLSAQGDYENALLHLQKALEINVKCLGPSHVNVAVTYLNMGSCVAKMGRYEEARDYYQKCLEINQKCLGDQHISTVNAKSGLALIFSHLGELEKALKLHEEVLETQVRCLGTGHVSVADTKYNMALVYRRQGATAQARRLFGEAGAIYRDALGATHSKTLNALRQAQEATPPHEADSEEYQEDAPRRRPVCGRCVVA